MGFSLHSRSYPMGMMFVSLITLAMPGILFNNFANSGINPAFTFTCGSGSQGNFIDFTCQNSQPTGCNLDPAACTLSGNTISFINTNSPFIQGMSDITHGNVFALFSNIQNKGPSSSGAQSQGPFDFASGASQYYTVNCGKTSLNPKNIKLWTIDGCTQTNPAGNQNVTKANAFLLSNWNTGANQCNCIVTSPFFGLQFGPNGTGYSFNCALFGGGTSLTGFGSTNSTGNSNTGYTIFGCDLYHGVNPNTGTGNPWMSGILSIPNSVGPNMATGYQHFLAYFLPEPWETYFCGLYGQNPNLYIPYGSPQCLNAFNAINSNYNGAPGTTLNWGLLTPIVLFALGLVLFFLGLGINIGAGGNIFGTGTSFTVGNNVQGTRLAQVMGLGLLAWVPLYALFSPWFTSGILPNGFDGTLGITSILLTVMFFVSAFWLMLTYGDSG